jgi:two-component system, OmpR family, KDP operon response regulator KdpE
LSTEMLDAEQGTILVVDDDLPLRRALHVTLSGMGFRVVDASRGEEAVSLAKVAQFDAVLLDVDIPGMGGVEACRNMRNANARLPILMLSAMDSVNVKEMALDAGADDYITKPFKLRELAARLRSAVRRGNAEDDQRAAPIRHGELELDLVRYRVQKCGRSIHLSPKEFEMLHYFMIHAGELIPHAQLLKAVWGPEHADEVVYLRIYVGQLRKKIEDDPLNPKYIRTVPHVGYKFEAE